MENKLHSLSYSFSLECHYGFPFEYRRVRSTQNLTRTHNMLMEYFGFDNFPIFNEMTLQNTLLKHN